MSEITIRPVAWEIEGYHRPGDPEGYIDLITPRIEERGHENEDGTGRMRYAVVYRNANLNRSTLDFDYESMPSHRTEQFFKTHRFYSIEDALECFKKFVVAEKRRYDKWVRAEKPVRHEPVMFL